MDKILDKRFMILFCCIALALIVGCGAQVPPKTDSVQPNELEPKAPAVNENTVEATTPAVETKPTVAKEVPVEEKSGSDYNFNALPTDQQQHIKQIRKLLASARTSEENYFFRYSAPGVLQTDVWVKGDLMKRSILRLDEVDKFHQYNLVYMNRATLKIDGYCETTKSQCPAGHGPFADNFAKRNIKTPKDWVAELDDDFYWALDNKIGNQLLHIIDYRKADGTTLRVYVSDYKGWPTKVELHSTSKPDSLNPSKTIIEEYIYDDFDIGGVSDEDVQPQ